MTPPLMPKATAVWLIENTTLAFDRIADFCAMHPLEVQGIADGEVAIGIVGLDPTTNGQLTREEIGRCEADPSARLVPASTTLPVPRARAKGARYTPVSKRQDRPDGIAWVLRNAPELTDAQITRLLGTTKATIAAVRNRTHWNIANVKPRSPVTLGICTQEEMDEARRKGHEPEARPTPPLARLEPAPPKPVAAPAAEGGPAKDFNQPPTA